MVYFLHILYHQLAKQVEGRKLFVKYLNFYVSLCYMHKSAGASRGY